MSFSVNAFFSEAQMIPKKKDLLHSACPSIMITSFRHQALLGKIQDFRIGRDSG